MNDITSSLSLHFFVCKTGLSIAPTSQDWREELNETMPGQLSAQCLACSRCSLNLSCDGPFQALSIPRGLGSGRSCSTAPPADSQQLAEPPSTGALSLPGQPGVCPGGSCGGRGGVCGGDGAGGQVGSDWAVATRPFRSPVACLVAHRYLQCDSPGGRAEGEWLGFPWNPGNGDKKEGGFALTALPGLLAGA